MITEISVFLFPFGKRKENIVLKTARKVRMNQKSVRITVSYEIVGVSFFVEF